MQNLPTETKDKAVFHIILVQGIVFKDGKALIAQRSFEELQSPGLWSLPGGKVELYGDEEHVIEKTIQQEFREEVGIELEDTMQFCRSGSFIRKDGSSVVSLSFLAKWKSGEAVPLEDTIAVAWIGEKDIEQYEYAPTIKERLKTAFATYEQLG